MTLEPAGLGARSLPKVVTWAARDCAVYALGVGAGVEDLAFTTDNTRDVPPRMLPTMPVVLGVDMSVLRAAGTIDWVRLVHAEQSVELLAPLPVEGSATATTELAQMWDKGSAALLVAETTLVDDQGQPLSRSRASLFIKGAGGWGGERGPSSTQTTDDSPPDETVTYTTRDDQALLYRLSGDRNPLHSAPSFARRAGFERPILHGLCTFGFAGRAVLQSMAKGDPDRVRSVSARFASPV
ncbi:MAG: 3-hydroxyacyl-thioester dehydratase, partial [Actinomycetota bacterium]|nr:3-hydroxyacyl-thioester dehydratase [Actinomycetota bacterium]